MADNEKLFVVVTQAMLSQMYIDMYVGKDSDNLSVTARLLLLEERMERMIEAVAKIDETIAKAVAKVLWGFVVFAGTVIGAVLTDIIIHKH